MALDVNGYNSVFKSFVDFAQERIGANQAKAVADARIKKFNGEEVLAIAHVKTDDVHKWLRTGDECDVNDRTRAIFRAAVANMFGGESKIPESVKKAMLMEDYDKGKPLTARRIMAVKEAIDADGTAKARSATIRFETLDNPATKTTLDATGKNYQEGMPKTILNANDSYFKPDTQRGMEKFIFEEIASNASLDLAEQDPVHQPRRTAVPLRVDRHGGRPRQRHLHADEVRPARRAAHRQGRARQGGRRRERTGRHAHQRPGERGGRSSQDARHRHVLLERRHLRQVPRPARHGRRPWREQGRDRGGHGKMHPQVAQRQLWRPPTERPRPSTSASFPSRRPRQKPVGTAFHRRPYQDVGGLQPPLSLSLRKENFCRDDEVEIPVRRNRCRKVSVVNERGPDGKFLVVSQFPYFLGYFVHNLVPNLALALDFDDHQRSFCANEKVDLACLVAFRRVLRVGGCRKYERLFETEMRKQVIDVVEDEILKLEAEN